MTEVVRITFGIGQDGSSSKNFSGELGSLVQRAIAGLDDATRRKVEASGQCTVVYHSCGTCENGGALVEYYCSDGGSTPDFTRCESCD